MGDDVCEFSSLLLLCCCLLWSPVFKGLAEEEKAARPRIVPLQSEPELNSDTHHRVVPEAHLILLQRFTPTRIILNTHWNQQSHSASRCQIDGL